MRTYSLHWVTRRKRPHGRGQQDGPPKKASIGSDFFPSFGALARLPRHLRQAEALAVADREALAVANREALAVVDDLVVEAHRLERVSRD